MQKEKEWFENWFDTSFYHILYDYRNDDEAKLFMSNLIDFLHLSKGDSILDLPCGKGRHARFLHSQGFTTTGADLSANSIEHAKQFQKEGLSFEIHDMRDPLQGIYDSIFNLFTSFGYFNQETTNIQVLKNFKAALRTDGHIVIDFLNLNKVKSSLIPEQEISKKGIDFLIRKRVTENFIIKEIELTDQNEVHHFQEKVQALDLDKMQNFAKSAGLTIQHVFGDYELNPFNAENSDRLILIMQ
ncbi:SAM-dependent methyltransferase [Lutimonas sp.]|uniref:SAM-dependent methyltransferase n=1 Tax=Lutimonas sp. TaxID=1872403 RepID=UPI003D9B0CAB